MNGLQKVIKYCAMAFAVFLSVTIFSVIIAAVTGVAAGITGVSRLTGDKERIQLSERYTEAEIADLGLHSVLLDCNAEIVVQRGDVLSVEAYDVTEDYKIRCNNGKLCIVEEDRNVRFIWKFSMDDVSVREKVVVTIPEHFVSEQVVINSGSGKVLVTELETGTLRIDSGSGPVSTDKIQATELWVDSGSGKVIMKNITASETELDTGSGSVAMEGAVLGELRLNTGSGAVALKDIVASDVKLDSGSGAVAITGELSGNCVFKSGSGAIAVALDGAEEDYRIVAECGSGTFRVNGKKMEDGVYGNDVKGTLSFDAGSGSVKVEFNTPEAE